MANEINKLEQLKPHQSKYILKLLAYFESVENSATIFQETYGVKITLDVIEQHHPESKMYRLDEEAEEFFSKTQEKMIDAAVLLPCLNKLERMQKYQQLIEHFQATDQGDLLVRVLELVELESRPVYEHLNRAIGLEESLSNVSKTVN